MQIFVKLIVMREIKFRGKCVADSKHAGRWVCGGYSEPPEDSKQNEGLITIYLGGSCTCKYHVIPKTVGQFTGLHDKNGKEIYEGDIVRYSLDGRKDVGYIGFHTRSASFRVIAEHTDFRIGNRGELHELNLEVIGNIHDNFDLLKK